MSTVGVDTTIFVRNGRGTKDPRCKHKYGKITRLERADSRVERIISLNRHPRTTANVFLLTFQTHVYAYMILPV